VRAGSREFARMHLVLEAAVNARGEGGQLCDSKCGKSPNASAAPERRAASLSRSPPSNPAIAAAWRWRRGVVQLQALTSL